MDSDSSRKVAEFAMAHRIGYPLVMGVTARLKLGEVGIRQISDLYKHKGEQYVIRRVMGLAQVLRPI
jgi:hypothetical protein